MEVPAALASWQSIAQSCQKHRDDTIATIQPPIPSVPTNLPINVTGVPQDLLAPEAIRITSKPVEVLLNDLSTGQLTSTAVTKAFLQGAGLAQRLVNCITEVLPARALNRAKFLDEYFAQHGKPIGPLHGLPISVKEHISMKDLDINAGFVAWAGRMAKDDALVLKLLWRAGAVFHVRTMEPQMIMHLETSNNLFGATVNPFNTKLTAGGSSGGEGALIALSGSCLGIGTDIGGSIRSPAANNGIYGLRPSTYRLPGTGIVAPMLGEEQIIPVNGPLSTSLEGIKIFMKTVIDQKPWLYEPSLVPIPWKDTSQNSLLRRGQDGRRKLRIGVLRDDGIVKPHPPVLRGLDAIVQKLQAHADIELVDFPAYRHDEAWRIISALYFPDGGSEELDIMAASGEPLRPLSDFILKQPTVKANTVSEVWKLTREREAYKAAYAQYWNSINTGLPGPEAHGLPEVDAANVEDKMVDVVLSPVGPGVAPKLDTARYWSYTSQWNLLDYPAIAFPTGLVSGLEDAAETDYVPRNEQDAYNHALYDSPASFEGAPIGLQLISRRYEDEKLLEAMEFVLEAMHQ